MQTKCGVCLQTITFETPTCKLTRITLGSCWLPVWADKYLRAALTHGDVALKQHWNLITDLGKALAHLSLVSCFTFNKAPPSPALVTKPTHLLLRTHTANCHFPKIEFSSQSFPSPHTAQGFTLLYSRHFILSFTHLCSASNEWERFSPSSGKGRERPFWWQFSSQFSFGSGVLLLSI